MSREDDVKRAEKTLWAMGSRMDRANVLADLIAAIRAETFDAAAKTCPLSVDVDGYERARRIRALSLGKESTK